MAHDPPARTILTYAQTLRGGGVERVTLRLAEAWIAAGRRVVLVVGDDTGVLRAEMPGAAETIVLGTPHYRSLAAAIPGIVAAHRPDVIFCPGNHYTAVAAWTRVRLGSACPPTIAKLSNALDRPDMTLPARAAYRAWLRAHHRFVDALVAMSPAMAVEARDRMGLSGGRVHVIPNPSPRRSAEPVAGPALPPHYLLGVGRLAPQKRWDRAIAALPHLADRTIPLVLLGDGDSRDELMAQAVALGVADRLILAGHVADPLPMMAGAAAVVLTSDYEGVPGVLREALSVSTPVVTTDSSVSLPEIVTTAAHGTIVPRDDAAALVRAIDAVTAPGRPRPTPLAASGDPAADYLALFDSLASSS